MWKKLNWMDGQDKPQHDVRNPDLGCRKGVMKGPKKRIWKVQDWFRKTSYMGGGGRGWNVTSQEDRRPTEGKRGRGVEERETGRGRVIFYKQKLKRSDCQFLGQSALNKQPRWAVVLGPVATQQCGQASTNCDHTLGTYCEPYRHCSGHQHIELPFILIHSIKGHTQKYI